MISAVVGHLSDSFTAVSLEVAHSLAQSRFIINVLNGEMNFYYLETVILNNFAWVAFRAGIDHIYILVNGRYEGCFPSWRRKHIK